MAGTTSTKFLKEGRMTLRIAILPACPPVRGRIAGQEVKYRAYSPLSRRRVEHRDWLTRHSDKAVHAVATPSKPATESFAPPDFTGPDVALWKIDRS